jgi:hypothetical protein
MAKFRFIKDYKVAGKKVGDPITLPKVPHYLKSYLEPAEEEQESDEDKDIPTKSWKNEDIVAWLAENGVEAKGTKDELLKEVKKVLKG